MCIIIIEQSVPAKISLQFPYQLQKYLCIFFATVLKYFYFILFRGFGLSVPGTFQETA